MRCGKGVGGRMGGGVLQRELAHSRESGVNGPGCPLNAVDIVMANNPPPPPVYPKWELWDSFKGTAKRKFHFLSGLTRYYAMHMHFVDAVSFFLSFLFYELIALLVSYFIIALPSFYYLFSFSTLSFLFYRFHLHHFLQSHFFDLSLPSHSLSLLNSFSISNHLFQSFFYFNILFS